MARIPRTAPLSSNYRSNGASLGVDPTPASICRLALIQLPRRQLPRWYTCGRFIASTVIRVRHSPLFSTLPLSPSLPLANTLYPSRTSLTCFLVQFTASVTRRCDTRSAFHAARCFSVASIRRNTKNSLASPIVFPRLAFFYRKFGFIIIGRLL